MKKNLTICLSALALLALGFAGSTACAQGTAFSYNGRLYSNGGPASGSYDLTFTLFNVSSNGVAVAGPVTNSATAVNEGLFNVTLDFGPGVFSGANYWLEIGVRTNGDVVFSTLSPRQPILPTPYAIMAGSASNLLGTLPATRLSGTIPNGNLPASAGFPGTVSAGAYLGNGGGLTNLAAPQLEGTIPLAVLPPGVLTNGSANAAFNTSFFVTNTMGAVGDNDHPGVWGITDTYFGAMSICNMSIFGGYDYWGADPEQYSDYTSNFNEDLAAGSPCGQLGLSQYIWNTHILSLAGDNRTAVGVVTTFGTNAEYGNVIEMLPRRSTHANINSGLFAHPLRLDGYGRVMVGNIPESEHTRFYIGSAYLDLWTGGNTDVPAMLFEQDGLSTSLATGALERNGGLPYWTDGSLNRSPFLLSGHPGNGSGLTNVNASAIVNGFTTSIVVSTPTGTATLFFTNGLLQAVSASLAPAASTASR